MIRTQEVDLCEMSKGQKTMRVPETDLDRAIIGGGGELSFEDAKNLYKRHEIPRFLYDHPIWLHAYKEGCIEFFVVDANRMEDLLAKASGSTKQSEYPYLRSIYGFENLVDGFDLSDFKFDADEQELGAEFNKFIALLNEHATSCMSADDVYEIIKKSEETIPAGAFVSLPAAEWPSHIDYAPTWMHAREMGFDTAADMLLDLDARRYLALARPDLEKGKGEWDEVHEKVRACLRGDA
jgi:hypothetical protein